MKQNRNLEMEISVYCVCGYQWSVLLLVDVISVAVVFYIWNSHGIINDIFKHFSLFIFHSHELVNAYLFLFHKLSDFHLVSFHKTKWYYSTFQKVTIIIINTNYFIVHK